MSTLLIQNARTINERNQLIPTDVYIKEGKIQSIGQNLAKLGLSAEKIIDVQGGLLTPGLVDVHVHFREPGFTHKETIKTGSLAAARGGYTTVCAMPNLDPVPDTVENWQAIEDIIQKDAVVNVLQYATITKGLRSEELVDYQALKEAGVFAVTNDGVGVQTAGTMYLAMKEAARVGLPIVAHTEDESLLFGGCMHHGKKSEALGLPGIISATESSQIARDLLLAEETGAHYHVCHVSTKESVRIIREAKQAGINVTCEVCPHHLILSDEDIPSDNAIYKMNPPLRALDDQAALIEGLLDGTIDCIATDHAPHTDEEKAVSMTEAPFGIVGSETAFSLMYTHFVKTGRFTLKQVVDWMTIRPANIFGLSCGTLDIGSPADLAIYQLDKEIEINADEFESKSFNTPFIGEKVLAETLYTLVNGKIVWSKEG
ncbi:dihydroorotase [Vagococcus zengguangii]|uniref:Dihydroorotase n=1 Tax=Vagococcus zengguangii TaxID=2571750 RepID=A0A4D7CW76_9ENTE|nr:dihydroorotase [Vagococcus zengguangii]QCI86420.1 dihydroorotase [Vagococcus zengguangii]